MARRRSRWGRRARVLLAWITVAVVVIVVLRRSDDDGGGAATTSAAILSAASTTVLPSAGWEMTFVADGDTFDAVGPEGGVTVRILGINAPEYGECGFTQSGDELRRLVQRDPLILVQDRSGRDEFGRLLRYVVNADGVDVGAAMIESGRAISRRYWPDEARNDQYDVLEASARLAGAGGWGACGAPAASAPVAIDVHPDADGPDNENLNGEWVRLTNTSTAVVDLHGWTLADSTSSNRYSLGGVVLDPGASVTVYSGCGVDGVGVRYWCADGYPIWNNDGDTVFVRDPAGINVAVLDY